MSARRAFPSLVAFLHHYLKLDVLEFTREVQPTWKQGIRFEWGLPGDYVFQAPFDWEVNGIGMLGSMAETGDVNRVHPAGAAHGARRDAGDPHRRPAPVVPPDVLRSRTTSTTSGSSST